MKSYENHHSTIYIRYCILLFTRVEWNWQNFLLLSGRCEGKIRTMRGKMLLIEQSSQWWIQKETLHLEQIRRRKRFFHCSFIVYCYHFPLFCNEPKSCGKRNENRFGSSSTTLNRSFHWLEGFVMFRASETMRKVSDSMNGNLKFMKQELKSMKVSHSSRINPNARCVTEIPE